MISIIIPVYNASKTIEKCVRSIINQTFTNYEIILINDCSSDNSREICLKLASSNNRIKYYENKINSGVELSRFNGLKYSTGEFIMFLDCDDWLEGNVTLETMNNIIIDYDVDYVEVQTQRVLDKYGLIKKRNRPLITGLIKVPELMEKYYISFFGVNILSVNVWGKLYKRSTIEKAGLMPHGLKMCDDLIFNMHLFPFLKKIYILKETGHNYRYGGLTTKYNPYFFNEHLYLYELKKKSIEKYNYPKAYKFINIELKNICKSEMTQAIRFIKDERAVINIIESIMTNDKIIELKHLIGKYSLNDDFTRAFCKEDCITMYNICLQEVKKDRLNYLLKSIISKALS